MKTLTIRRHAQRSKPGSNLSRQGIDLAKLIAPNSGPFDIVATANIPRAIQTAIVLGHEVTRVNDALGYLPREIFEKCAWPGSFSQMSFAISNHKSVADFARTQAMLWKNITDQTPESGCALIISHGAIIELGTIASLPEANHAKWGKAMGYCEGVRLTIDNNVVSGDILRVPKEQYQLKN